MRAIYAVVEENGKKTRKVIILEDRKCIICGEIFSPQTQLSEVCSRKCSKKKDYLKHSDRYKDVAKKHHQDNIEEHKCKRKEKYWSSPELYRAKTKEYCDAHREEKRAKDQEYKDLTRHGGLRKKLIEDNGLVCARCGIKTSSSNLDGHHTTWNKEIHEHQELLCKSCHAKEHGLGKRIGRYSTELTI